MSIKTFSLFWLLTSVTGLVREREYTVEVSAGKEDCFYESVLAGDTLEVEYQVIDGGQRDELIIDFKISRPDGMPVIVDLKKMDNAHRIPIDVTGDYKICFDNGGSKFSPKIVFFEIVVEKEGEDDGLIDFGADIFDDPEDYDVKVQIIDEALKYIRERMTRSRHFQDQIRATEYRDRSIAEHNFEKVNFWSLAHIMIMIVAGICQVVLVRSLFDEKSQLHAIWKKFC